MSLEKPHSLPCPSIALRVSGDSQRFLQSCRFLVLGSSIVSVCFPNLWIPPIVLMASVILDIIVGCFVTGGGRGWGPAHVLLLGHNLQKHIGQEALSELESVIDLRSLAHLVIHARPSPQV